MGALFLCFCRRFCSSFSSRAFCDDTGRSSSALAWPFLAAAGAPLSPSGAPGMAGTELPFVPSIGYQQLLLLSLLNLGCILFCLAAPTSNQRPPPPPRRRKISPFSQPEPSPSDASQTHRRRPDPAKPESGSRDGNRSLSLSIRSYLRQLFSFSGSSSLQQENREQAHPAAASAWVIYPASPAQAPPQQLRHYLLSSDKVTPPRGSPAKPVGVSETCPAVGPVKRPSFASRADIYPCASCGEVFNKALLLDLHQASRHALSELSDGDSGKNIVEIIFRSGWKGADEAGRGGPAIHRVLKIHHSPRTLARFEEYRDAVRSRAAAGGADERCVVDGNERLRFYCATFLCGLARVGNQGTCDSPFCAACGIVRHGFSGKDADGIPTHATAWAAHATLPEELEREFEFMHVRRAMLVCRVVAGRVAPGKVPPRSGTGEEDDGGYEYDSVVGASAVAGGRDVGGGPWTVEGELVVFNARAVLPCFVVVYRCV